MWAELLANAMDPNRDFSLQHVFIDALKQFEPLDAIVFKQAGKVLNEQMELPTDKFQSVEWLAERLELRQTQLKLSVEHLHELGCVRPFKSKPGYSLAGGYVLSILGIELYLACQSYAPD